MNNFIKSVRLRTVFWLFPFAVFLFEFFWFVNSRYPWVGHDFNVFPYLLYAGRWHFFHQGIVPLLYIVQLCGGQVAYGNPTDVYYSLAQLLSFFVNDWDAIQITIGLSLIGGYWAWFRIGETIIQLKSYWSHVLALAIVSNGLYFVHVASGHYSLYTMPLIGIFLLFLFSRKTDTVKSLLLSAIYFSMLALCMVLSANWYSVFFALLVFIILFPLDLILSASEGHLINRAKTVLLRSVVFGGLTFLLTFSKLTAVASHMRLYPRHVALDSFTAKGGTLWYIAKAFWAIPQSENLFQGIPWYVHEKSAFISPIILIGLLLCVPLLIAHKQFWKRHIRLFISLFIYALFFAALMIQFVRGYGFIVDSSHQLPVFSSQHVATRYLYVFLLPITVAGIWLFTLFIEKYFVSLQKIAAWFALMIVASGFYFAYKPLVPSLQYSSNMGSLLEKIRNVDKYYNVEKVILAETDFLGNTALSCSDALLGSGGWPQLSALHVGSVFDQSDNYFNIMNPACYQYPKENNCKPGDRISINDRINLESFITGKPVSWKLSKAQILSDRISLYSFGISLGMLVSLLAPSLGGRKKRRKSL